MSYMGEGVQMSSQSPISAYDGNIMSGPLSDIFTMEVTAALARCRGCGNTSVIAELVVYGPEPGMVACCPGCGTTMLRLVHGPHGTWLDLAGTAVLRLPPSTTADSSAT